MRLTGADARRAHSGQLRGPLTGAGGLHAQVRSLALKRRGASRLRDESPSLRYFSKAIALDSVANSNDTIADSARVGTHLDRWSMTLLACPAEARSCVTRAEAGVPKGNRAAWTDGQTAENALDPAACLLSGRFAVNEARPNVDPEPLEHGPDTVQEYYRWSAHCPGSRVVPLPPDECVQQVEQAGIE
jgi:hypothetical protein